MRQRATEKKINVIRMDAIINSNGKKSIHVEVVLIAQKYKIKRGNAEII